MDFHLNKAKAKQATDTLKKRFISPTDLEMSLKEQMGNIEEMIKQKVEVVKA